MPVKFVIASPEDERAPEPQKTVRLVARKTLDGNIMIMDHDMIDIVIMPGQNKVITFAKTNQSDVAYETQDRLFKFLHKKGFILPETIKSGNVYGSLEGEYPATSDYANTFNISLMLISEFVEDEKQFMSVYSYVDDMENERLLDPDAEDSTELGEVPHEERKGSMGKVDYYPAYYYGHMYQE
jgi:hypothetical protein